MGRAPLSAAGGVVIMMISGVDFQMTIPPGLLILLIPAGLVAVGRWRWTRIIATLVGLFVFVSYFPSGAAARLLEPSEFGAFIGLWLQFLGSFAAVVAGMVAATHSGVPERRGSGPGSRGE
jgi:hypothetical protein